MVRLLFFKLGSNPETRPIVENIRARLGECFIAGVEEHLEATDSVFDAVLTSHDDGLFGAFSRFDLNRYAMTSDLYDEVRGFEGQGMRMIERLKYYPQERYLMPEHTPVYQDTFQSRSDLFFRYCVFWNEVLNKYKFDAVISQNLAHMAWELPLEKLCTGRRIPFLIFTDVGQWPRIQYVQETVETLGVLSLGENLKKICAPRWLPESTDRVVKHLDRLQGVRDVDDPLFGSLMPVEGKAFKTSSFAAVMNQGDVRQEIQSFRDLLGAVAKKLGRLLKNPLVVMRNTPRTVRRAIATRRAMNEELAVCQEFNYDRPFVYFPLHFQPEASTGAKGRHFVEQREAVALISQSLPSNWLLVVKEHPHQYRRLYARQNYFWQRIASIPNVVVVSHDVDSRTITEKSEGIVSISHSSIATEAWVAGKRVVFLGDSHLREAPGISTASSLEELRSVWESPPPKKSLHDILGYLRRVEASTIEGTLYGSAWYLSESEQSEINQRTQHNLTELILAWLSTKNLCSYP